MSDARGKWDRANRQRRISARIREDERDGAWRPGNNVAKRRFKVVASDSDDEHSRLFCSECLQPMQAGEWAESYVIDDKGTRRYRHRACETLTERRRRERAEKRAALLDVADLDDDGPEAA